MATNYQQRALVESELGLLLTISNSELDAGPTPLPMHRLRLPVLETARLLISDAPDRCLTATSYNNDRPPTWNITCKVCQQIIWRHPITARAAADAGTNARIDSHQLAEREYRLARLATQTLEHGCWQREQDEDGL